MTARRLWVMRAAFAGLVLFILYVHLLPLQTMPPSGLVSPDMLMLFAFAWSVRRPEFVPALLLALLFLLADLLLQRPPGLWSLLMLLACERLKTQSLSLRDAGFATECVTVMALIVVVFASYRIALALTLLDLPSLGLWLMQVLTTLVFYPVAVALTHGLMGVRKLAPGDLGAGS